MNYRLLERELGALVQMPSDGHAGGSSESHRDRHRPCRTRDGRYGPPPAEAPVANPLEMRIAAYLLSHAPAGDHLIVLKTPPGEAPGVALALDRLDLPGVVGTVAGDDTIFVAVAGRPALRAVQRRLDALMR